ncbi:MAG: hypothetical protein COZ06_17605 [Armatimonadetes bacterium CG_4_10_14_3_um_filter_66_18]|nr:copper amine oxidase N-terminal domain-containing protein [Armatimonadota bacterium]OIP12087.1 MAG: hypothetical protein AUJ96_01000 [Armatimonadetes bacterium CG2_30_66_41]PIU92232.1 MAG: hypothetical protein COS65_18990 [Armatimonadetes bacterium CG06_land_8_20_14_3_00_66_21]PIW17092.1 MAG: hypothetical protein COW34_05370 [Armatimonadetes bacterium CG17_big_fil_post_rev_8_21_14_2_50_66_6]PIX43946.1 MAG: hypothetical protein COZ57_18280 [Armatimonadetes bacterium CG_4_8_14_3_um_filter_66_2
MKARMNVLLVVLSVAATSGMASIQVEVNGRPMFFDVPPMRIGGRTMVPLRGIFESLGAQVQWDASSRTITATKDATNVQLGIGDRRAAVNGQTVLLDVPASILRGSTMVPLRFVSEALGADVKWFEATQLVSITSAGPIAVASAAQPPVGRPALRPVVARQATTAVMVIPEGTVIPVSLDMALSSATSRQGDRFDVSVSSARVGDAEFPLGTKIEGIVAETQQASSGQPGMLDLSFRDVILASGERLHAQGSLIALDDKNTQMTNGRLEATPVNRSNSNPTKLIAIGAGAGLILGKLTDHTLEGTLLGALGGYLYSESQRKKAPAPTDVAVAQGAAFGVRLDRALSYTTSRAFAVAREGYVGAHSQALLPVNLPLRDISVGMNGQGIRFAESQQPFENQGLVLVLLQPVMTEAQVNYSYDDARQTIRVDTDRGALYLKIGSAYALLEGSRENLETPAQLRGGAVFVPLHFLALATGTDVLWNAQSRAVTLTTR